jgi:hypothetical protein
MSCVHASHGSASNIVTRYRLGMPGACSVCTTGGQQGLRCQPRPIYTDISQSPYLITMSCCRIADCRLDPSCILSSRAPTYALHSKLTTNF